MVAQHSLKVVAVVWMLALAFNGAFAEFKMGMLFSGPYDDMGWNYGHEQSRIITHRKLIDNGYSVHVELEQNVDAEAAPAIVDSMGSRGFDVVFLTSSVFGDVISAERLARWINTTFVAAIPGSPAGLNAVGVNVRVQDARFLAGLMCGLATKTNKVGYVIPLPITSSISQANAFAVGAKSVNPNVEIGAVYLNTFYNPLLATKAANYLMDDFGADCGTAQHDDNSPQKAFNDRGMITTGYNGDMRITTGMNVYFSQMVDYSDFYWKIIQARLNGNFSSIYGGKAVALEFKTGLTLSAYSPAMSVHLVEAVEHERKRFYNGTIRTYCNAGQCFDDTTLRSHPYLLNIVQNPINMTRDLAIVKVYVAAESGLGIAIYIIASILILCALGGIIDTVIYRNTQIVRAASPLFCVLMGVGFIAGLTSVYMWVDVPSNAICNLRVWLGGLGFATVFGAYLIKNWRIRQLFLNESLEIFAISNRDLLLQGILPSILIEIVILIVWTAVDPYSMVEIDTSPLLAFDEVYLTCRSFGSWPVAIFLSYKCLILVVGVVLSYQIRHVDQRYNESGLIALSIYTAALIGLVAIVVNVTVPYSVNAEVAIVCFGILIVIAVMVGLIFGPKSWRIHIIKNTSHASSNNATTMASVSPSMKKSSSKTSRDADQNA